MADPNTTRLSIAMERTGQWIHSQDLPSDLIVEVGGTSFSLHKYMVAPKSNYIRQLIKECDHPSEVTKINLSDTPGGPKIFEKLVKFCYGVNFEITIHNVAALHCAAKYLEITDLADRTDAFLSQVAFSRLNGAVSVLKSCHHQHLLPFADDLNLTKRCVQAISYTACTEANFPTKSPANWWSEELTALNFHSFAEIIAAMKKLAANSSTIATALVDYTEKLLADSQEITETELAEMIESIVSLFPKERSVFSVSFLCYVLRCAVSAGVTAKCRKEVERRVSEMMEEVAVEDLMVLSFSEGEGEIIDVESVRRVILGYVEKEKCVGVCNGGGEFREVCSGGMERVAKTVDAYLAEIALLRGLSISKFNAVAVLIPKAARMVDDDLYRAIDLYLKAHPNLDEIEREKACSVMDPLKLSYEARVHASQNKRLPVQIVLHALYYDQLKLRSAAEDTAAAAMIQMPPTDKSLARENEELKTELLRMKMYLSEIQNKGHETTSSGSECGQKKSTFLSSVSKKLSKLNPFKLGSKDTSNMDDRAVNVTKPKGRTRRFSIS